VPDAWMDRSKDKVGYEINFKPPFLQVHTAAAVGGDRRGAEAGEEEIMRLLREVTE